MGYGRGLVLGISADFHDSAAALVDDGVVLAAAEEERFTRRRHESALPEHAVTWCLESTGSAVGDLIAVVFYEKPMTTYERILLSSARRGPHGVGDLARAVPRWSTSKLWVRYRIEKLMSRLAGTTAGLPSVYFSEHHMSHAASAFYPSPFPSAAVLTVDGVGEWTSTTIGRGSGSALDIVAELVFPNSLGLFYSAVTAFCGFAVNDGEYKLMGLAPYGEPAFAELFRETLIRTADDGAFEINERYFGTHDDASRTNKSLARLVGGPPRSAGEDLTQFHADVARSAQVILEDLVLGLACEARRRTGETDVCLAGGVALNCVAVQRLCDDGPFERIWVQPASGDAGGAIGAALWFTHEVLRIPRKVDPLDGMAGSFLGPDFTSAEVHSWLSENGIPFEVCADTESLTGLVAAELAASSVIGWFQGRMEFGPRALGHRSILADPRDPRMVGRINSSVKGREGFRPLAPSVLIEHAAEWFNCDESAPYMTRTAPVRVRAGADRAPRIHAGDDGATMSFAVRLGNVRSPLPSCTHVDGSARIQTVDRVRNPLFHGLLESFYALTGCPVLLNTSFNAGGEPIVCSPADAYRTFLATGLDVLVIEDCVIRRDHPEASGADSCS